jgi:hypothetical protein
MRTSLRLLSLTAVLSASIAHAQQAPAPAPAGPDSVPPPAAPPAAPPVQGAPATPAPAPYPYAPPAQAYPYVPPAYPYAPPVDPAQRAAVLGELANVDAQIANIQAARGRHGLGGPIAMMASGFGTAAVFSIVALVQWGIADDIQHDRFFDTEYDYEDYDLNDDGIIDEDDEQRARRGARTLGTLSFVGIGVGIGGSVFLARRLAARRKFNPELNSLRARRIQLLRHLQYGGALSKNGMQLTLGGHF